MKRLLLCCLCIGLLFSSQNARAEESEKIVMLFFEGGYPPFYMERLQEGIFVDFVLEFEKQYPEFKIIRQGVSRKRIDKLMEQGKAQVSSLTNPLFVGDENVRKNFLFSKPLWKTGNYIMMTKENAFEYTQPEDLFGKKLGVIYGNRNGILDPHIEAGSIEAVPVKTNSMLYKILQKGAVDAIIANKHVAPYEMKLEGIDRSQFIFSEVPLFEFELMTQVQKTHQHFVDKFNAFIEQSQQNGFLDQLVAKYLE